MAAIPAPDLGHAPAPLKTEVLGVDLLRFCAAALVVVYHLGYWDFWGEQTLLTRLGSVDIANRLAPVSHFGWIGVELFFVISGFIIPYSAERASPFTFFRSRFLRLMPAVWIAATLAVPEALVEGTPHAEIVRLYVRSVLMYPRQPWINGVMWTLPIEISFYGMVFVLLLAGQFRRIVLVASIIGSYSSAYWILHSCAPYFGHAPLAAHLDAIINSSLVTLTLMRHGCFFALGVFLWRSLVKHCYGPYLLLVPVLLSACIFEISRENATLALFTHLDQTALIPVTAWFGCIGLMALSVICNDRLLRKWGAFAPYARWLGLLTYPLYLLHQPIALFVIFVASRLHIGPHLAWCSGVAAAVVTAAWVTSRAEPWVKKLTRDAIDKVTYRLASAHG
jgi:peptidoglycan/LPS O-acetylase OafA/YrhL